MTDSPSTLVDTSNKTTVIIWIVTAFLIADVILNYVAEFIEPFLISLPSIILFTIMVGICSFGAYFLLKFVREKSKSVVSKDPYLKVISTTVMVVQFLLIALVIFLLFEILFTSQYDTPLFVATALISEIVALGLLGLFAQRFLSWFILNRQSTVVLIYGLSFAVAAFSLAVIVIYDVTYLPQKDPHITPQTGVVFPNTLEPGSLLDILFSIYTFLNMISFGLLILGTAILLFHYSKKIGQVKFWVIILLPLVYFISSSVENLKIYAPTTDAQWFNWYLFSSLNSTAGGILFGVAFWTIGKTFNQNSVVKDYLKFAAFGFVLLFISTQASPSGAPYPPYGIITMTFLPLSSHMIFLGLYSTAISISQDIQLRQSIKKVATQDSNLLSSIGTAHMEQEIQRKIDRFKDVVQEEEKELEQKTGIEANIKEEDLKSILEEVLQEVGKTKKPK
ncbi:MAG: hypothetical protein QN720_06825 [Nitrososphaeraceae archaeon]|nr:hypothetical protein [Nitrososphaeraceae archaeon]MDW0314577.1 hypothetical protein [Nitrososphaeraceae archaeon]MDW0332668.1 hypothetical protein [Nitrososphaeraceae archaeon]